MADLILAAKRGVLSTVLSELRDCVPVDYQDEEEATALYWASCSGHDDICQLLLDKGANPNLPVKWGSTALHAAADRGHIKCIRLLLRYNAFVNAVNSSGDTSLHLAAYRGWNNVCMVLVGHKADLSIINKKGKTPQHEAQSGGHRDIAVLLGHKPADHRPRSFPADSSTGKEPSSKSVPLTSKQYEDWDRAHRSASYPLDQSTLSENGHGHSSDKPTNNNAKRNSTEERRSSLRRELLLQPQSNRRGINNIPYMNQLSQDDWQQHHLHHRPYSDPTALLHRSEVPTIEGAHVQSVPAGKNGNLAQLDNDGTFRLAQRQSEREHHAEMLEENQVKMAMLVSKNEALEKKLKEHARRVVAEERRQSQEGLDGDERKKLEMRIKELMSEVSQERRERNKAEAQSKELADEIDREKCKQHEADARSRHLASELFHIMSVTKPPSLATPTKQDPLATPGCSTNVAGNTGSGANAEAQRDFALRFCRSTNKTFTNLTSNDLQDVLGIVFEDQGLDHMVTSLKTAMSKKCGDISRALAAYSDEIPLSVEPGALWENKKNYTLVGTEPVDSQLMRNEDGFATEVIFRIECQSKMAAMKMILNHGQAPSLSKDVQFGSECSLLTSIPAHRNITRILHWYSQPVTSMKEQLAPFLNASMGSLPKNIAVLITPEYRLSLESLRDLWCNKVGALGERCVLKILSELVQALCYLKTHGIVHRDIGASKVFVDRHLRVVLCDFGMARRVVNESDQPIPFVERSQIQAGNPLAWAPELTRCNNEGPPKSYQKSISLVDVYDSSDLYAVAASICHMINETPQDKDNPPEVVPKSQQPRVPDVLSARLQALLSAMLQENQQDRPTLQEVALRVNMLLFGPAQETIKTQSDCESWIQAQLLRLLAVSPSQPSKHIGPSLPDDNNDDNFDGLAKQGEWLMCYDYVSNVTALQLWELCQDAHT